MKIAIKISYLKRIVGVAFFLDVVALLHWFTHTETKRCKLVLQRLLSASTSFTNFT